MNNHRAATNSEPEIVLRNVELTTGVLGLFARLSPYAMSQLQALTPDGRTLSNEILGQFARLNPEGMWQLRGLALEEMLAAADGRIRELEKLLEEKPAS